MQCSCPSSPLGFSPTSPQFHWPWNEPTKHLSISFTLHWDKIARLSWRVPSAFSLNSLQKPNKPSFFNSLSTGPHYATVHSHMYMILLLLLFWIISPMERFAVATINLSFSIHFLISSGALAHGGPLFLCNYSSLSY